mgnify:CR=1 FL=1
MDLKGRQFPEQRRPADAQLACEVLPGAGGLHTPVPVLTGQQMGDDPPTAGLHGEQFDAPEQKLELLVAQLRVPEDIRRPAPYTPAVRV